MSKNPYQILHLEENASYQEIKERYRHLTRSLHPDKQPLQNYQATKKLFEQIDEAYKSISSPLRRFLFRQYGLSALKILEEVPDYFEEFDVEEITGQNAKVFVNEMQKLHQLMIFLLYEKEASMQSDKTKFITKMVVNISKTLKGKPKKVRKNAKRNYILPEIQNCTFEHEMMLPQLLGFANSLAISHTSANIKNDPKQSLGFSTSSVRRFYYNYMVSLQSSFTSEQTSFAAGVDRIYQNNMTLNFTPLSITNWRFNAPRIGIEKAFQDYQISASAAMNGFISIDYTESMSKKVGKSLKFMVERGSIGVIPKVQVQVTDTIRMFVQFAANIEDMGKQGIKLHPSFVYGYRMTLNDDLKIEFSSCIGTPNYLQLSIINSKFRVGIPFIAADVSFTHFQTIKVALMISAFLMVEGWKLKIRKDTKRREKLLRDNQFRLGETKRDLNRKMADLEMVAHEHREKQIKQNGLVILKAYFGQKDKINAIMKKLITLKSKIEPQIYERQLADLEQSILNFGFSIGNVRDEVEDITGLLQNQVIGGQIRKIDLSILQHYSPIIDQTQKPYIVILYIDRGEVKCHQSSCNQKLSLGTLKQSFSLKKMVRSILRYLS